VEVLLCLHARLFINPLSIYRHFPVDIAHLQSCTNEPGSCLQCQMAKVADGLMSGPYTTPSFSDSGDVQGQDGLAPGVFKAWVSRGHPGFSTMRQQDLYEFFQRLIKIIRQNERVTGEDPTKTSGFKRGQRLQCNERKKLRYTQGTTTALSTAVPATKKAPSPRQTAHSSFYAHFPPTLTFTVALTLTLTLLPLSRSLSFPVPISHEYRSANNQPHHRNRPRAPPSGRTPPLIRHLPRSRCLIPGRISSTTAQRNLNRGFSNTTTLVSTTS
jgi:hypothetical protein